MLGKNRDAYYAGEMVLMDTRPRIFLHIKSAIVKLILICLIIFLFIPIINETVRLQAYFSSSTQIPLVEGITIGLLAIIFILLIWTIWNLISWKYTNYILTNQRVIIQRGLISKKRYYIHYDKIEDIAIYQSFFERILSSGDIVLFSGHENTRMILRNVPKPGKMEQEINMLIEGDLSFLRNTIESNGFETEKSEKKQNLPKKPEKPIMERHAEKFKR
jgi:membrane protein YdbS with pleckstrin-like domain